MPAVVPVTPAIAPERRAYRPDQLQRALERALPASSIATGAGPLELSTATEPPLLVAAELLEDDRLRIHVPGAAIEPPFAAFLDGTQRSDLVAQGGDGAPIVSGVVAAVIREWSERSAHTWQHVRRHRLYAPRAAMTPHEWSAISAIGLDVTDTSADEPALDDAHPAAQRDAALRAVRRDRERLELQLAHRWCAERTETLYIDGGLRGSEVLARAAQTVGVIKSHRTLYGDRAARRAIYDLAEGERTSVFVVASPGREPVASWYLRLRGRAGRDVLWGLVRVEVSHAAGAPRQRVTARADAVSRRILAERTPTAHPDARWDTMVYGVRDCEVLLKTMP